MKVCSRVIEIVCLHAMKKVSSVNISVPRQKSLFQKCFTLACLLALFLFFFFFFYFIYIKKNPCILNELGKYIQNEIDLQSKSDLYFITGWKFEEMNIIRNKVSRSVSSIFYIIYWFIYIHILTLYLKDSRKWGLNLWPWCVFSRYPSWQERPWLIEEPRDAEERNCCTVPLKGMISWLSTLKHCCPSSRQQGCFVMLRLCLLRLNIIFSAALNHESSLSDTCRVLETLRPLVCSPG